MNRSIRILSILTITTLFALTVSAQNWHSQSSSVGLSNISARQTESAVYFPNGTTLSAYTSNNTVGDSYADAYLYLVDNGGSGLSFGNPRPIRYISNGYSINISGNNQPAMVLTNDGVLYLCFTSGNGQLYYTTSTDQGNTWAAPTFLNFPLSNFSPSLTYDPNLQIVYVGFADKNNFQFHLCTISRQGQGSTCINPTDGHQMNYGPSIVNYNGTIFHCLS